MRTVFWSNTLSFSLTFPNPLIDLAHNLVRLFDKKYVGHELNHFSINSPCRFPVLLEIILPPFGELDVWLVHRRELLHRAFSTNLSGKEQLSHKLLGFSRSEMRKNLQEVSLRFLNEEHPCKKIPLVLTTMKLIIAQLLQSQVITQCAT